MKEGNQTRKKEMKMQKAEKESVREKVSFRVREHRIVLVIGIFTVLFMLFILVMGLEHPSPQRSRLLFFCPLAVLSAVGAACCMQGLFHGLTVEEMQIEYRNWRGRRTSFTLDDIGYCKLKWGGSQPGLFVYDLLGKKLCKLSIDMNGCGEFLQYVLDNRVRVEWKPERRSSVHEQASSLEAVLRETAVCEEEISGCAAKFYDRMQAILQEWEKSSKLPGAHWEFGFGEYAAADLQGQGGIWNRTSSLPARLERLPEDYICLVEAYLKKEDAYVMDRKQEAVCMLFPYITRGYSYQVGERLRIRKMDEDVLLGWMQTHLALLARTLPKRRYHTEPELLQHELKRGAGLSLHQSAETVPCPELSGDAT